MKKKLFMAILGTYSLEEVKAFEKQLESFRNQKMQEPGFNPADYKVLLEMRVECVRFIDKFKK